MAQKYFPILSCLLIQNTKVWYKKKSDRAKNMHVIKDFCFSSNFDESWSHCSTHQYYNLTNFHQNLMKNEKYLLIAIFASVRFFSPLIASADSCSFFFLSLFLSLFPPFFHLHVIS